jgi:hypothetical protein
LFSCTARGTVLSRYRENARYHGTHGGRVDLSGNGAKVKRRVYILADGWDPSPFRCFARKYEGQPGWEIAKFPCGHDVMVDMPDELAAALAKIA